MGAASANVTVKANFTFNESFGNFGSVVPISLNWAGVNVPFVAGASGDNTYQNCYAASLTVTAGTPVLVNLTNGSSIKNPDGSFAVFGDIVALGLLNNSATTGQFMTIGGGTNDVTSIWGASGTEIIMPGGMMVKTAPKNGNAFVVTATTACVLQIVVAAGTSVPFDLFVLGH